MKSIFVGLFLFVLPLYSASAACGGGGWKKDSKTEKSSEDAAKPDERRYPPIGSKANQKTERETAPAPISAGFYEVKFKPADTASGPELGSIGYSISVNFDTAKFDARSAGMALSAAQSEEIAKARAAIDEEHQRLIRNRMKAEQRFRNCTGDCKNESASLAKASSELQNSNPNGEFDKRLRAILNDKQYSMYKSAQY